MFCTNCGNQLSTNEKFCSQCGNPSNDSVEKHGAQIEKSDLSNPQTAPELSTGKIFMEQLSALSKTGAEGVKQVASKAQNKAIELSQTVEQSKSLQDLGDKKKLFLVVCGALLLNSLLMLSKTIYFELTGLGKGTFSIIGFCSNMLEVIDKYGLNMEGSNDGPLYTATRILVVIGIIFSIAAIVKTSFPIFTSDRGIPISFKLIKSSALYNIVLTFSFLGICSLAYSSQRGIEFHLTTWGWLYIIESIALIILVFKLCPNIKKDKKGSESVRSEIK